MTVADIKDVIGQLSETERQELVGWLEELQEDEWDRQMEKDFSPGGRGHHLVAKVDQQIAEGEFSPMEAALPTGKQR